MATPAGAGYRSPLNIGLDQLPKTTDPLMFQEMIPVYNAIHTLNAYLDRLRLSLEGGDSEKPPSEEMRFVRGFWLPAASDIEQGNVLTTVGGKLVKGCGKRKIGGATDCFLTGIAMTSAKEGEKVRIGIGPAILEIPGFKPGEYVYAQPPSGQFAGAVMAESFEGGIPIGYCVANDYILFMPDFSTP
jgi:hypothetical protein